MRPSLSTSASQPANSEAHGPPQASQHQACSPRRDTASGGLLRWLRAPWGIAQRFLGQLLLVSRGDPPASLVRLRATLLESTAGGEKLLAQRNVVVQRPAPSADAPGGVRALAAAVDAAADELVQWLAQVP